MSSVFSRNVEIISVAHQVMTSGLAKQVVNRYTYGSDGTTLTTLTDVKNAFVTALDTLIRNCLSVSYIADYLKVRFMDNATNLPSSFVGAMGNGNVGSAGTALPASTAAYIKLGTNFRGRNWRGSKHYSPLDDSHVDNGEMTAAAVTAFNLLLAGLVAPLTINGDTWYPTIQSQSLSQTAVNPVDIQAHSLATLQCRIDKTIGTMRHRRPKTVIG